MTATAQAAAEKYVSYLDKLGTNAALPIGKQRYIKQLFWDICFAADGSSATAWNFIDAVMARGGKDETTMA